MLRCNAYLAAASWLITENMYPLPIPMLMSWPPSGVSITTRGSPPYLSRLPRPPWANSLLSKARRLSPIAPISLFLSCAASPWLSIHSLFLPGMQLVPSILGPLWIIRGLCTLTPVGCPLLTRRPPAAAESTNLSPAWQSEVRASRSWPAILAVSALASSGPLVSSARGRPGSPARRTPTRTSRSLGSIPRFS